MTCSCCGVMVGVPWPRRGRKWEQLSRSRWMFAWVRILLCQLFLSSDLHWSRTCFVPAIVPARRASGLPTVPDFFFSFRFGTTRGCGVVTVPFRLCVTHRVLVVQGLLIFFVRVSCDARVLYRPTQGKRKESELVSSERRAERDVDEGIPAC